MIKKYTPKKFAKKLVKYSRKIPQSIRYDGGFPLKKTIGVKYCSTIILGTAAGSVNDFYNFACNSYFDPDYSGGGHQPYGHDENAQAYNYYKVKSSKIKVQWLSKQGAMNLICGVNQTSDVELSVSPDTLRERPKSNYTVLTTQRPGYSSMSWKAKKVFTHDDDNQAATMGVDPAELDFYQIWCHSTVPSTNIPEKSVSALVTLTMVVELYDRKNLAQS